jgi:CrcB protein
MTTPRRLEGDFAFPEVAILPPLRRLPRRAARVLEILVIGVGGFIGAIARYGLSGLVQRVAGASFPAGTLLVNVVGCALIGAVMCLVQERQLLAPSMRRFLVVGLLGGFTTFSAVAYETFELLRGGDWRLAMVNAVANVLLGLAAVALGWVGVRASGL